MSIRERTGVAKPGCCALLAVLLLSALPAPVCEAQAPYLVRDINAASAGTNPSDLAQAGDLLFVVTQEPDGSAQLWRTDDTASAIVHLADLPSAHDLTDVGGSLYFWAESRSAGYDLWTSDGSEEGTRVVANLGNAPADLTALGSTLYFLDSGLWKCDGTGATLIVGVSQPRELTNLNGTLFFVSYHPSYNEALFRSDGTAAGTVNVSGLPWPVDGHHELTAVADRLFLIGYDDTLGDGLYVTDGTAAGAVRLGSGYRPTHLTNVGGTLFFSNSTAQYQPVELWKSDGTPAGTVAVAPGGVRNPTNLTDVGGEVYFRSAFVPGGGDEVWKSDGSAAGTVLLHHFASSPGFGAPGYLTVFGGDLFFEGYEEATGFELWRSDGTPAGTQQVIDLLPGADSGDAIDLTVAGGSLFFAGYDGSGAARLWKTDGTAAGTVAVPGSGTSGSDPSLLTGVGAKLFFRAYQPETGFELWKSDGTEAGTALVSDLQPGPAGSQFHDFTAAGPNLFFRTSAPGPSALWVSDGSETGTIPLATLVPNADNPIGWFDIERGGSGVWFTNADEEIWHSDGTVGGTVLAVRLPGVWYCHFQGCMYFPSGPDQLTDVDGALFFVTGSWFGTGQLWKSDGTDAGTFSLTPGYLSPPPSQLTNVAGTVFFAGPDLVDNELWRSDGTVPGTFLLADLYPGGLGSQPSNLTALGTTLLFSANEPVAGRELWKSDGTGSGTVLVADVNPGAGSSNPDNFTRVGANVFFTAFDPAHGVELWKSDGSAAGTVLVADLAPGPGSSSPSSLHAVGGVLHFSAFDPVAGRELWRSDGMTASRLADLWPGVADSSPSDVTSVHGSLFFAAGTASTGRELWSAGCPLGPSAPDTDDDGICDAIDPCTNVGGGQDFLAAPRPRVTLSRINTDPEPGNDGLFAEASFVLGPGAAFGSIDPVAGGARIVVSNADGTALPVDVRVPSGAYDGWGTRGWSRRRGGSAWTYRDSTGSPLNGLVRLRIHDESDQAPGRVGVRLKGERGLYPVTPGDEPLQVTVVVGEQADTGLGYCGESAFAEGDCSFNREGDRLRCR